MSKVSLMSNLSHRRIQIEYNYLTDELKQIRVAFDKESLHVLETASLLPREERREVHGRSYTIGKNTRLYFDALARLCKLLKSALENDEGGTCKAGGPAKRYM